MNILNECSNSGVNFTKKNNFKKINLKKNIQIIDDPAFHLNRTLKAYINNRLNNNISTEKIETVKNSNDISKLKELNNNNSFNRAKTLSNIINKKQYFSKKKIGKLKKQSHQSKSRKKLIKSISSNKLNISTYINFYNNRCINKKKEINKNKILKKNSNNSQKYVRYSGSTALSNNTDTNQLIDKNNSILPYNNHIQILTNHSTLDINALKSPITGQTTSKKSKFTAQYFPQNANDKNYNKYPYFTNEKNYKYHKNNNIKKNKQNLINNYTNNLIIDDNNKNPKINSNTINQTENNIQNFKLNEQSNGNTLHNTKEIIDNKYSYTLSNNKTNTPKKILNNSANINNINQYSIDINSNNKIDNEINSIEKENNQKYLKKIEMLENENKLLKGEIKDSNNRLQLLENKINELLLGKNTVEKEACPQPTPYVKKYTLETIGNISQSPMNINTNSDIGNKINLKHVKGENDIKNNLNKNILYNKIQNNFNHVTIKIKRQSPKFIQYNTNKFPFNKKDRNNINTPTKINVNKYSKNLIINKKVKKRTCKKINKIIKCNLLTEENKGFH